MLQNVVERVSRAELIDEVFVACPCGDGPEIADATNAIVYYPAIEENDLIGRFLACAKQFKADFIIRICSDNPVVEPGEIDHLVLNRDAMGSNILLMNSEYPRWNHDGFGGELYSKEMLEWMDRVIKYPVYREHPHKFWIDMECFSYCGKPYPPGFRLDINTQADYEKVKRIFDHFGHNHFTVKEAMEFLGSQDLEKLNLPA